MMFHKFHLPSPYRRSNLLKETLKDSYNLPDISEKGLMKISLVTQDGKSHPKSSAFIRLISPLIHLHAEGKLQLSFYGDDTTTVKKSCDICIVQRSVFSDASTAEEFISFLKKHNIPLIFDSDDAMTLIDDTHPEYSMLTKKNDATEIIIKNADAVWVSTEKLKSLYSGLSKNIRVVENSLDKRLWKKENFKSPSGPLRLIYMGTATHNADFDMIFPALDRLHIELPSSFELTVIGVTKDLPDREWITRMQQPRNGAIYPNFVKWFTSLGPFDAGLSPLVSNKFNDCKSDIKCLDYLGAGIIPVVSDVPAYKNPELDDFIIRVNNTEEAWFRELRQLAADISKVRKNKIHLIKNAQRYIYGKRSSKESAAILYSDIQDVLEKR